MDNNEIIKVEMSRSDYDFINKLIDQYNKNRETARNYYHKKKGINEDTKTYNKSIYKPQLKIIT